jgi:hypothetical protein
MGIIYLGNKRFCPLGVYIIVEDNVKYAACFMAYYYGAK